jgi:hypothetical protein
LDLLNVPGPSATSPAGSSAAAGSTGGMSASPSTSPQTAVQLPGEAPNTTTEGPTTTASQPGVPSSAFCNSAMPSTAGALSLGDLSGAMSPNGC